jgi:hypothetical protein
MGAMKNAMPSIQLMLGWTWWAPLSASRTMSSKKALGLDCSMISWTISS